MGKMKELFMASLQDNSISANVPREDDSIVFLAIVQNYTDGTIIKVGAFHSYDVARAKGQEFINRRQIDAADVNVYPMSWTEINGHM
jgi:hypothetical protein